MIPEVSSAFSVPVEFSPERRETSLVECAGGPDDMILLHVSGKAMLDDYERAFPLALLSGKTLRKIQLHVERNTVMLDIEFRAGSGFFVNVHFFSPVNLREISSNL